VKLVLLEGSKISSKDEAWKTGGFRQNDSSTSHIVHVLQEDARPFIFRFRSWTVETYGTFSGVRAGRLIEPHITQLLQKFGAYFQRQGVSRLPDEYYYAPAPERAADGTKANSLE
jgi:hypothetical protein